MKCLQAVNLLEKSRVMGIIPNTIMYNTAMSSLGKSGQWEAAERLFGEVPEPDAVTYETLIAAYGMAGQATQAEIAFKYMQDAQHTPRDYAYCGLIAAHRCVSSNSLATAVLKCLQLCMLVCNCCMCIQ